MVTATLAFLSVVLLIVLLWRRMWWLALTDGMMWVLFGIWEMTEYAYGEVMWYAGLFFIFVAMIVFMSVWWMRPRREPGPLEPSRRQQYEERLDRELNSVKKKREV